MNSTPKRITLVLASLAFVAACGCENFSMPSILGGAGAGAAAGAGAKSMGASNELSIAIGAGVGVATAVIIDVLDEREATEQEQNEAKRKADAQLENLDDEQKSDLKKNSTYVAVPISENEEEQTKEVMIVDPESGEPVSDTVYVVDNSASEMESQEKVELDGYDAIYVE